MLLFLMAKKLANLLERVIHMSTQFILLQPTTILGGSLK